MARNRTLGLELVCTLLSLQGSPRDWCFGFDVYLCILVSFVLRAGRDEKEAVARRINPFKLALEWAGRVSSTRLACISHMCV